MRLPGRRRRTQPPARQRKKKRARVLKVVVTGLSGSGKTQFIQSVSQYTEWQGEPENSWFFGRVRVDQDVILHFLEPPIARQFDFMWLREVINRVRAVGFIVMVDSTRPNFFGQFLSILYTVRGFHGNLPLIVVANKQDSPHAWSAEDIQIGLGIHDIPVYPCVAYDGENVRDVVIELLHQIAETPGF